MFVTIVLLNCEWVYFENTILVMTFHKYPHIRLTFIYIAGIDVLMVLS